MASCVRLGLQLYLKISCAAGAANTSLSNSPYACLRQIVDQTVKFYHQASLSKCILVNFITNYQNSKDENITVLKTEEGDRGLRITSMNEA